MDGAGSPMPPLMTLYSAALWGCREVSSLPLVEQREFYAMKPKTTQISVGFTFYYKLKTNYIF